MTERGSRRVIFLATAAAWTACGGGANDGAPRAVSPPAEPPACKASRAAMDGVAALEAGGHLERASQTIAAAVRDCPLLVKERAADILRVKTELATDAPLDTLLERALDAREAGDLAGMRRAYDQALAKLDDVRVVPRDPLHPWGKVAFGDRLLLAVDGHFGWYEPKTGRARIVKDDDDVSGIMMDRAGNTIAAYAPDATWVRDGKDPERVLWQEKDVRPDAFTPTGQTLIVDHGGGEPTGVEAHDARTGALLSSVPRASVTDALMLPGHELVAYFHDGVNLWDTRGGAVSHWANATLRTDVTPFSDDGARFAFMQTSPPAVKLVDVASRRVTHTLQGSRCDDATIVTVSPDGARVAVGGKRGFVCIWDLAGPVLQREIDLPVDRTGGPSGLEVRSLVYAGGGAGLVVGTRDRVDVYRASDGARLSGLVDCQLDVHHARDDGAVPVRCPSSTAGPLAVTADLKVAPDAEAAADYSSPDGSVAVGMRDFGRTQVEYRPVLFDPRTGNVRAVLRNDEAPSLPLVGFLGGGRYVIGSFSDMVVALWDARTGALRAMGRSGYAPPGDFVEKNAKLFGLSPAFLGKVQATAQQDGSLDLVRGDAVVATLVAVTASSGAALLPDGTYELFGDHDQASRAFSCGAGKDLYPLDLCEDRFEKKGALSAATE